MTTDEMAQVLRVTNRAVIKSAAKGLFGAAAHRLPDGAWTFGPGALPEYLRTVDRSRMTVERLRHLEELAAPRAAEMVAVWSGPGGRHEAPRVVAEALQRACDDPEADLLTPELCRHLDRIMNVVGLVADAEQPAAPEVKP